MNATLLAQTQHLEYLLFFKFDFDYFPFFLHCSGRNLMSAASASVGLAPPGNAGSWQYENKVIHLSVICKFKFPWFSNHYHKGSNQIENIDNI